MVRYQDLVANPKLTVENIYQRFRIPLSESYQRILEVESAKAKLFKSKHRYSLKKMGLNQFKLSQDFKDALKSLDPDQEPRPATSSNIKQ
jgi:hypothetical protein